LINLFREERRDVSSPVQSVEVSYFLQMTEDEERVKRAVAVLLGRDPPVEREVLDGHFGNAIVWVRNHLTGEVAELALSEIVSHIDRTEVDAIIGDLESMIDEHNALFLRLNKQVLVMRQSAVRSSADPIRVKLKPRSSMMKGDPVAFYAAMFRARPR